MRDIKLSVIVLSYNQEKYIKETLDSILSQKHDYSFEVIVCDDASQDRTPNIIMEYATRYDVIVPVIRKKNLGLIANYFDAVSRCNGEYLMICAGDDYWLPGKVEKQIIFMDSHPYIGACIGDAITIDENGDRTGSMFCTENPSFESHLISNCGPAASFCYRMSLVYQYIKEVDPVSKQWVMEDLPINMWFSVNSKIQYLKGECVAYRVLSNSLSHFDKKQCGRWVEFRKSAFSIRTYFINKYPEKCLRIRETVAFLHVRELFLMRTFSHKELKAELSTIIKTIPYLSKWRRKGFYLINNFDVLNAIFVKWYSLKNSGAAKNLRNGRIPS